MKLSEVLRISTAQENFERSQISQVLLEHLASLALWRTSGPAANCPKWEWWVRYRTICYHIKQGEDQTVLQVLVQPVMGGAWWRRNYVQHSTNGLIPLHLTSRMEEIIDFNINQFSCLYLTMFFIPREETWGKSPGPDLSGVLATAKTHANYTGKGWFTGSGRSRMWYRVWCGVMIAMKNMSRSRS